MWVTKAGTETQKEQNRGAFSCSVCLHEKKFMHILFLL